MLSTQQTVAKNSTKKLISCTHCGEECPPNLFTLEDKSFCCAGCQTVFQLLNENGLSDFYQLEDKAGISFKNQSKNRYDWLDEPNIIKQLIDYEDEEITKITLQMPQIHCISCVWLLENLSRLNPAVISAKVNFLKREAYITFDHNDISLRELAELLSLIGYAPSIDLHELNKPSKPARDRTLSYQIGLAGFAFGNIMLFSFPEYLGLEAAETDWFRPVFGFLNLALAIPVLLYSGKDYLRSAWHGLQQKTMNIDVPVSLGMLTLFGRSAYEIISQTGSGYFDSLAGLIFFLLIGKWFQRRTYNQLTFDRDYESYFPVAATVVTEMGEKSVSLPALKIGDLLRIRHGEIIPADGILHSAHAAIDYSFVTGEAEAVQKKKGDLLYAGGRQTEAGIDIQITKKPSQSYLLQLWNNEAFTEKSNKTSLLADRVGKYFTYVILFIAFITLTFWLLQGDISTAINAFTAVLIIACPCAVALAIPFTFGTSLRFLSKQKMYLKNTSIIERMSDIDAVVFDKTGTITTGEKREIEYRGFQLPFHLKAVICALAQQSGHPLSRQIAAWGMVNREDAKMTVLDFKEVVGKGISGNVNGLFCRLGNQEFIGLSYMPKEHKNARVFVSIEGEFFGSFSFPSIHRPGLSKVLNWAKSKGEVYLLSGDNEREQIELSPLFGEDNLHFSQSPQQKLDFIKALQDKGKKVLMLGDGLNDAGALQQSEVGIVVAENVNNFVPACDIIISAEKFTQIPDMSNYAVASLRVVYAAYFLAFCYNIVGLSYAVTGTLSPVVAAILMPLSSLTIVIFGVIGSQLAARKTLDKKSL